MNEDSRMRSPARLADDRRTSICVRDCGIARAPGLAVDVWRGSNYPVHAIPDAGLRVLLRPAGLPVKEICR